MNRNAYLVTMLFIMLTIPASQACATPIIDTGNPHSFEAPPGTTDNSVKVSNLVEQGCAISWITDVPSNTRVEIFSDASGTTEIQGSPFTTNLFTDPSTKHYVQISSSTISSASSGSKFYYCVVSEDGSGSDRAPSTGFYNFSKVLASGLASGYVIWGSVLDASSNPVAGAIVIAKDMTKNSPYVSFVTDVDGVWYFDIYMFRDASGNLISPLPSGLIGDTLVVEAWCDGLGNATTGNYTFLGNVPGDSEQLPDMILSPTELGSVATPKPDLALASSSISFTPSSINLGDSVQISADVMNIGDASASSVQVNFYDGSLSNQIGTSTIASINVGETKSATMTYTPSSGGAHEIIVVADPSNAIEEYDETNNNASKTLTVIASSNVPPVLTSGTVSPSSGNQTTLFTYSVNYSDADDNAPTVKNVVIDGTAYTMFSLDTTYTDGAIFTYETTLAAASHNYYFTFCDGIATVNTTLASGPTVTYLNHVPTLTGGTYAPSSGTVSTEFTYTVTYTDLDNDAPTTKAVIIDGISHNMTTTDTIYSDGSEFTYVTTLSEGTHNYKFQFSDGHDTVSTATLTGPTVGPDNNIPVLTTPAVSPTSGYVGQGFTYSIVYTDAENTPPTLSRVVIDGASYAMTSSDGTYNDGSLFTYSTTLAVGSHNYYFMFSDGYWNVRAPETGTYTGPTVTVNAAPSLISPEVTPSSGIEGSSFTFKVTYQDPENVAPTTKNVVIDGVAHTMMTTDSTYSDGSLFNFTTSALATGTHSFYFEFSDGMNVATTTVIGGPTVYENTPPSLSNGLVSPSSGVAGTSFTYSVMYTDAENGAPAVKRAYIDGVAHEMTSADATYSDGAIFQVSKVLNAGTHQYYFVFSDGKTTVRLPAAGNFTGPTVTTYDNPPVLSGCVVTPQTGDTSTTFTFSATYTDAENCAPTIRSVYIDGVPSVMSSLDTTYADGAAFTYSTTLSEGSHSFYFYFCDGTNTVQSSTLSGPTVTPTKHAPTVYQGEVSPTSGTTQTIFTYSVLYTDLDNDAPTIRNVYIDGIAHAMSSSDTTYTDGATFIYSTTLGLGSHTFYFHFSDGTNEIRLPTTGAYSGPAVSQAPSAPTLTSGAVSPTTGDTLTTFWFNVTYKDLENEAPTVKKVVIDGIEHQMATQDTLYNDGSIFSYATSLAAGSHVYYFVFSDGTTSVRLPTSSAYPGPTVVQASLPPIAVISSPQNNSEYLTTDYVRFNASGSSDPEGSALTYEWKDNGKTIGTSVYFTLKLSEGTHKITLVVTDVSGKTGQAESTVIVKRFNTPPELTLKSPYDGQIVTTNAVSLTWEGIDAEGDYLTYDVYFDTFDATTRYAEMTDAQNQYVAGLKDGATYYWKVIASDGRSTTTSAIYSFKVNLTANPPSIQNPSATPSSAPFDGSVKVLITVTVTDTSGLAITVTADLAPLGGKDNTRLYDDGTHGDEVAKDSKYSLELSPVSNAEGSVNIVIKAVNSKGLSKTGILSFTFTSPPIDEGTGEETASSLSDYLGPIVLIVVVVIAALGIMMMMRSSNAREAERIAAEENARKQKAYADAKRIADEREAKRKAEEAEKNRVNVKCPKCGTVNVVTEVSRPYEFRCSECEQKLKLSK